MFALRELYEKSTEQFNITNLLIIFGLIIIASFLVDIAELRELIISAGTFAPLIFITLKAATIVIAPLSGSPLYPLVGLFFGFWPGVLYVVLGDFLGYSIAFFISRVMGRRIVERFISKKDTGIIARMIEKISTGKGFFQVCLTCFALPELLSYAGGLSKLPYWKFISILLPASGIATSILVLMGATFDTSNKPMILSLLVPVVGGLCVLMGSFFFVKSLKK